MTKPSDRNTGKHEVQHKHLFAAGGHRDFKRECVMPLGINALFQVCFW